MAENQGIRRLAKGIKRKLTRSEVNRGYLFLSKDKKISTVLNTEDFSVEIDGQEFTNRRIDKYGRFQISKSKLVSTGINRHVNIKLISKNKIQIST